MRRFALLALILVPVFCLAAPRIVIDGKEKVDATTLEGMTPGQIINEAANQATGVVSLATSMNVSNEMSRTLITGGNNINGDGDTDEGVFIDSDGDVGIGTNAPGAQLDVAQANDGRGIRVRGFDNQAAATLDLEVDENGFANIDASAGFRFKKGGVNLAFVDDTAANGYRLYDDVPFTFGATASTRFGFVRDTTSGDLILAYNSMSEALINFTPAGEVGVGTNAPADELHVVGGGLFTDEVRADHRETVAWAITNVAPFDVWWIGSDRNAKTFDYIFGQCNAGTHQAAVVSRGTNTAFGTFITNQIIDLSTTTVMSNVFLTATLNADDWWGIQNLSDTGGASNAVLTVGFSYP